VLFGPGGGIKPPGFFSFSVKLDENLPNEVKQLRSTGERTLGSPGKGSILKLLYLFQSLWILMIFVYGFLTRGIRYNLQNIMNIAILFF
jgi:hypothetical protein